MRKELELIEKIDDYINGNLTFEEHDSFQREIDHSTSLKKQVDHQFLIQEGIQSLLLKQKAQQAYKKYKLVTWLKYIGVSLGVIVLSAAVWSLVQAESSKAQQSKVSKITKPKQTNQPIIINPENKEIVDPNPVEIDSSNTRELEPTMPVSEISIEAEDYISFNDISPENLGNEYRNNAVDIYKSDEALVVGHTFPGEWLKYSFDIQEKGSYEVLFIVASGQDSVDREIEVSYNDKPFRNIKIPYTGSWLDYEEVSVGEIILEKGDKQTFRLDFNTGWINIDKIILRFSEK